MIAQEPTTPLEPDTKDWTWVLGRPCAECGLDVAPLPREELAVRLRAHADAWPQVLRRGDATERPDAVTSRYAEQDPAVVSADTVAFGHALADRLDALEDAHRARTGRRSDGAAFSVDGFARYLLHDPVHHLRDVGGTAGGVGGVLP